MKKPNVLWIILDLVFLIIFNAVFFVAGGFEHEGSVWISYGFIHFAYLMLLITPVLIRKGKSAAVFGFSLYSLSSIYFSIELVAGAVFIIISSESYQAAFLVQLFIAGLYGIALISNMISNESTAKSEEMRSIQINYVKNASTKLKSLLDSIDDRAVKKKLERVYDSFYSSPVKSHPNLVEIENRILLSINELGEAISIGDGDRIASFADSLLTAVNERNTQLKEYN